MPKKLSLSSQKYEFGIRDPEQKPIPDPVVTVNFMTTTLASTTSTRKTTTYRRPTTPFPLFKSSTSTYRVPTRFTYRPSTRLNPLTTIFRPDIFYQHCLSIVHYNNKIFHNVTSLEVLPKSPKPRLSKANSAHKIQPAETF